MVRGPLPPLNQRDRESVVPLEPYRWDRSGGETGLRRDAIVHPSDPERERVMGVRVGDGAASDHVVDDDEATGVRERNREVEVLGVGVLVRLDEDEVERGVLPGDHLLREVDGRSQTDLRPVREPGPLEVRLRDLPVPRVDLEADNPTAGREGPREPDRAVSDERADLEDPLRVHGTGKEASRFPWAGLT